MAYHPHAHEADYRRRLGSGRWEVRREALRLMVALNPPDLIDLLVAALSDRARGVRRLAAGTLTRFGAEVLDDIEARLDDPRHGAWCTVVLAGSLPGRRRLAARAEAGLPYLRRAMALPDLHSMHLLGLVKALAIGPMPDVGLLLTPLLRSQSVLVRQAAARALVSRDDIRVLDWLLAQTEWSVFSVPLVTWLGERGDIRAIPLLKRLCGFRAWLSISAGVRLAAPAALSTINVPTRHIPDQALTRAAPPGAEPTAAALSLWAEDAPLGLDDADD